MWYVLFAHAAICLFLTVFCKRLVPASRGFLPLVWLVPFAGAAMFLAEAVLQHRLPDEKRGYGDYRIVMDETDTVEEDVNQDEDMIVPMEEAMVEESEEIRRRLMFHLLDAGEADNMRLMQKIVSSDDTELAHFASTRIMSFRRDHEHEISLRADKIKDDPSDRITLEQYCMLLKEYIDSGILPPAIEEAYRKMLKDGYEKLIAADPKDMDHREAYLRFLMEPGKPDDDVKNAMIETLRAFPKEMRSYQLAAEYCYLEKDRKAIDVILKHVHDKSIYLNQAGRQWYAFWKGENV